MNSRIDSSEREEGEFLTQLLADEINDYERRCKQNHIVPEEENLMAQVASRPLLRYS